MLKIGLICLFLGICYSLFAQIESAVPDTGAIVYPDTLNINDSIIYDTVIVTKKPVVVKKEVVFVEEKDAWPFFIQAGVISGISGRTSYTSPTSLLSEDYLTKFEKSVSPQLGYEYGLEFGLLFDQTSYFLGLIIQTNRSKFEFSESKTRYDHNLTYLHDTLDAYYTLQGADTSWVYVIETDSINTIDTVHADTSHFSNNNCTYFEIPVLFGYNVLATESIEIDINVGCALGFLMNENASLLNGVNPISFNSTEDSNPLFQNVIIKAHIEPRISYFLSEFIKVFGSPYMSFVFQDRYSDNVQFKLKDFQFGIRFGAGIIF
jgi:hypothetical protein